MLNVNTTGIKEEFKKTFSFSITDILDKNEPKLSSKYESESMQYNNTQLNSKTNSTSEVDLSNSQIELFRGSESGDIDQCNPQYENNYCAVLNTTSFENTIEHELNDEEDMHNRTDIYSDCYCEDGYEINSNDGNFSNK